MRVVMPIPSTDFDPTETAVPWKVLSGHGIDVVFATPDGAAGAADDRMLSGRGLGPWRPLLRASRAARDAYAEMAASDAFTRPMAYRDLPASLSSRGFDGVVLPGGHAPGMKPYLEAHDVQSLVASMFAADKPVGAICHGVLVLARTQGPSGASIISGRRLTALTRSMEMSAFNLTRLWLGHYYRTYPTPVENEVRDAVGPDGSFDAGPFAVRRDNPEHLERGFVVQDGNLLTARWPGDAFRFATRFAELVLGKAVDG